MLDENDKLPSVEENNSTEQNSEKLENIKKYEK